MYDELSLPFIDASLPPTPKVGRIVNGLDILLGHGVSENSLVGKFEIKLTTFDLKVEIFIHRQEEPSSMVAQVLLPQQPDPDNQQNWIK